MKKWKLLFSLAVPLALLIGWIAWADKALTVTELTDSFIIVVKCSVVNSDF